MRAAVIERLASGWSPEQIAGRLEREQGRKVISYETIYRFIYAQIARTKDYRWRHYLPRGKSKRGCRGSKGGSPASFIEGRVSLAERPSRPPTAKTCGHWEADLMMFAKYGQAILTVHERKSRLLLAIRLSSKAANGVARHLVNLFGAMPPPLRQTVTFDNGTEFARHSRSIASEDRDILLRSPRSLAEGRHRERHRPDAPLPAPQDRPRHPLQQPLPQPRRRLQQHPTQMP